MSIRLNNYASGEIEISYGDGLSLRLPREKAHRLILYARMHSVSEFVSELGHSLGEGAVCAGLLEHYGRLTTPSARWNFKERFARLRTVESGVAAGGGEAVIEEVTL